MRYDLPIAQQLVQIAHAGMECGLYLATPPDQPDNVVLIGVESEAALRDAALTLAALGIMHRIIDEPDLGDQITAICTEPLIGEIRKKLKHFRCWTPHAWERSNRGALANMSAPSVQS